MIDVSFDIPRLSAVERAALTTYQPVRQRVFAGVAGTAGHRFLGRAAQGAPSCHFGLHRMILLPADDGLVVVGHIKLLELPGVLDDLLADDIRTEGLLNQHIAAVFFVHQDAFDGADGPFLRTKCGFDLICFQPVFQAAKAGTAHVSLIDLAYHLCLLRNGMNFPFLILFIGVQPIAGDLQGSDLRVHLFAAPDVTGDGFAFGLRHRAVHGDHKFTVRWKRVDILLLEENPNPKLPENARIVDTIERVAGKSLDGLCEDHVDFLLFA